jgi:hypothetical protein
MRADPSHLRAAADEPAGERGTIATLSRPLWLSSKLVDGISGKTQIPGDLRDGDEREDPEPSAFSGCQEGCKTVKESQRGRGGRGRGDGDRSAIVAHSFVFDRSGNFVRSKDDEAHVRGLGRRGNREKPHGPSGRRFLQQRVSLEDLNEGAREAKDGRGDDGHCGGGRDENKAGRAGSRHLILLVEQRLRLTNFRANGAIRVAVLGRIKMRRFPGPS